jgi:HEPN domain-containing protein
MAEIAASEWIESAENDRDTVKILLASPRVPYEIVAYHCQQCAEKYLKAVFVAHGRRIPFIHDLLKLCRDIQDICADLKGIEADCERLTPFGTTTRYPGSGMHPGLEHMARVESWMESIRSAAQSCLHELPPNQ